MAARGASLFRSDRARPLSHNGSCAYSPPLTDRARFRGCGCRLSRVLPHAFRWPPAAPRSSDLIARDRSRTMDLVRTALLLRIGLGFVAVAVGFLASFLMHYDAGTRRLALPI